MKITTEVFRNIAILELMGELDSRGNQQLNKAIKETLSRNVSNIILDVQAIRFIGSQTISMLLSNLKEIRAAGGNLKIVKPQRAVLQYMKQNRIVEIFDIYSSKSEAVQAFEASPNTNQPHSSAYSKNNQENALDDQSTPEDISKRIKGRFETGEILYANSCMLATLIKLLETKGILSSEEAGELMDYERLSMKGVTE